MELPKAKTTAALRKAVLLIKAECDSIAANAKDIASDSPTFPQSHQSMARDIALRAKAIARAANRIAR